MSGATQLKKALDKSALALSQERERRAARWSKILEIRKAYPEEPGGKVDRATQKHRVMAALLEFGQIDSDAACRELQVSTEMSLYGGPKRNIFEHIGSELIAEGLPVQIEEIKGQGGFVQYRLRLNE